MSFANFLLYLTFLFRYKKELSAAVEREASLERSKAQLELDWQRRFEDLERQQYEKSEDLIRKLTRSRDEVKILYLLACITLILNLLHSQSKTP